MQSRKILRKWVEAIALTTLLLSTARAAQTKTPPPASVKQLSPTSNVFSSIRPDHVEISVPISKFEETIQWYKNKLGFKEQVRWTVETLPGTKLVYLELNGFRFEIVGSPSIPTQATSTSIQKARSMQGYGLFCFEVEDVDAVLAKLNLRGVPTLIPAGTYRLSNYWRRIGTVQDNNGNMIEFAEKLTTIKPSK